MQLKPLRRLRRSLHARLRRENRCAPRLDRPAMVFAPHQDDETLGCGGTIILKRGAATPVQLVFMTDGSTSHRRFLDGAELTRLRQSEAVVAASVLGVAADDVHFLGFPDSKLGRYHETAVDKVLELLRRHQPAEVFVPYECDGTPDHEATYRIVRAAVERSGLAVRLCEYPVWFWNQWPWVPLPLAGNRETGQALWRAVRSGLGLKGLRQFRAGVMVGEVLPRKREALAQHRSQMTALKPDAGWPTLGDVSGGSFLDCFFQEFEVFRCRDLAVPACSPARESGDRIGVRAGETTRDFVTRRWLLLLALVLAVAYTLAPFDFQLPAAALHERGRAFVALPAAGDWLKLAGHVAGFAILGGLLAAGSCSPDQGNRARQSAAPIGARPWRGWRFGLAAAVCCCLLEFVQFFVESRHARLTDLIGNTAGLLLGAWGWANWRGAPAAKDAPVARPRLPAVVLGLGVVIWFAAGLYPAAGVLNLHWDRNYKLVVGNESDWSNPWLGEIRSVEIYGRAFSAEQVARWCEKLEQGGTLADDADSSLLVRYDFARAGKPEIVPTGRLATEQLALEVPGNCLGTADGQGLLLTQPALLASRGPASALTEAILASGEFTVTAWVRPLRREQPGPARIVSLSQGIWTRNFMLGQEEADLVFRVRNGVNGANGLRHALRVRGAVREEPMAVVAVYDRGVSRIFGDGQAWGPTVDLREPGICLGMGAGPAGRAVSALLLTLVVGLPAAMLLGQSPLAFGRHALVVGVTFCGGSLPYVLTCLRVGGPWRWSLFCWLGVILLAAYPVCYWWVTGSRHQSCGANSAPQPMAAQRTN